MSEDINDGLKSPEDVNEPDTITRENVGKGLAFLGIVIFIAYVLLFTLSISMPQLFNLFSGPGHLIIVTIFSLTLIIGGYIITKTEKPAEGDSV
jgi:hypothetical protein